MHYLGEAFELRRQLSGMRMVSLHEVTVDHLQTREVKDFVSTDSCK